MNPKPGVQKRRSPKSAFLKRKQNAQLCKSTLLELSTISSDASTAFPDDELGRLDSRLHSEEVTSKRPKIRADLRRHELHDEAESGNGAQSDQPRTLYATSASNECGNLDDDANNEQPVVLSNITNNAVNKVQLRQRFFDLHFGATGHVSPAFVYEVLDITNPKKTALTAAMDTLCVAQLATSFRDDRLAATSRILYGQAIHRLNEKIGLIGRQDELQPGQLDEIIGCIHALVPSAWFDCVQTNNTDWLRHSQGLNRIIEIYGWQTLAPNVEERYRKHWERRAFTNSMIQRTRAPADCFQGRGKGAEESFFKSCAIDVPGLLERSDTLFKTTSAKKANSAAVVNVLTALGNSVSCIKRWQLHWTSEHIFGFRVVGVKTYKSFYPLAKGHIEVFPLAYTFPKAELERDFRLSHICLLALFQAIIDIHAAYSNICKETELRMQLHTAKYEAKIAADSMCMHVPYSAQPHFMAFACTYSLIPLYYASEYYEKYGHGDQLGWCREVSRSLSEKYGISIDFSVGLPGWDGQNQKALESKHSRLPRKALETDEEHTTSYSSGKAVPSAA